MGLISLAMLTTLTALWYTAASIVNVGLSAPGFWLGTSFVWLAWLILLGRGAVFQLRLPSGYYRLRRFELDGVFYRRVGILAFKRLTLYANTLGVDRVENAGTLAIGKTQLWAFEERCKFIEAAHAVHFVLLSPAVAFTLLSGRFELATITLGILLGFDAYPIALQRYNRTRLAILSRRYLVEANVPLS